MPRTPLCVIGDVHGCAAELEALVLEIDRRDPDGAARVVLLGDLLDRGPDSAAALTLARALAEDDPARFTCLMGNHEAMALAALELAGLELVEAPPEDAEAATGEAPHTQARARAVGAMRRWLQHGGIETIESFGLTVDPQAGSEEALADLAARLRGALPDGLEAWLAGLPRFWRDGAWAAAHAAGDPGQPLEAQDPDALIWGHAASLRRARSDGVWMIHGHWIVPDVTVTPGRIAVDTGAYRSGTLSAVWLDGQTREVWQTGQGAVARRALER